MARMIRIPVIAKIINLMMMLFASTDKRKMIISMESMEINN